MVHYQEMSLKRIEKVFWTENLRKIHSHYLAFLANRRLFEIDQYYESIKDYTFRTTFVPIELDEARAWRKDLRGAKLNQEETILFKNLKAKVQFLCYPLIYNDFFFIDLFSISFSERTFQQVSIEVIL